MTESDRFHAIVIGSGQGGTPLSRALAEAGLRTALVERAHVGGTCINEGCTPTKTMVASARVAYLARRAADYGVVAGDIRIDMARVRQRTRDVVTSFREGSERRIGQTDNLELIVGEASFTGASSVRVRLTDGGERTLSADRIFLNVGARPAVPALDGIDTVPFLNSTTVMDLDAVPAHLLVLGGGYVGLEFAQMFRRFGSAVTVVQRAGQLLDREDSDVAEAMTGMLTDDGVEILLNASARRVAREGDRIRLTVQDQTHVHEITGSHLLVAAGRIPNTDTLNLAAAGVETDSRGYIRVNGRLETSVAGVFALGDVIGGPAFTHIAYDDFRILRTNLLDGGNASIDGRLVPYTVFTDPELGRVGISEREARGSGRKVRVARMPMSHVARALESDEARGFMKVIVDAETEQILGAAIFGIAGGELMSMIELAMMGRLKYTVLRDAVFAHPTLAESLNNLFARFES